MAATVESVRQRDVLLDRQRLLAEGLAIMARSKLV
jgi:tetrahydromethanopterin S-methyltransferase subunit F